MKINRILVLSLFCFVSLLAMQDEESEPVVGCQAPVVAFMESDSRLNVSDQLWSLNQQLHQAYQSLRSLADPFMLEQYRHVILAQKERLAVQQPIIQLYQTLIHSRELFGEYTINLAVDLLWDAQNKGQESDIYLFSKMFARLEIAGSTTLSDEQLSSIQFRESGIKEAVEDRSEELSDIFRYKDSKERLKDKLKARIKVLPVEQRPELYICLKPFLRDIDPIIIMRNVKDDDICREWQQLAEVKKQIAVLSEHIYPYVNEHLESLRAVTGTVMSIRKYFRRYMLEGIESDRHEPLSNADRNLVREIDAFFQITQESVEKDHKDIDQALREFAKLSVDIENIQRHIQDMSELKGMLKPEQLPHDDPRYIKWQQTLECNKDMHLQQQNAGLLQRLGKGVLSVAKKAAPLAGTFAQSFSPQFKTISGMPQELSAIQENITLLIERLNKISQNFRSAALSERMAIEDLRILSNIFDADGEGHYGVRVGFNKQAWQDIHKEMMARAGQDFVPASDTVRQSIISDQEQSFYIPYQEQIEQTMAKQVLASSLRTQAVKALFRHILKPSKQEQVTQLIPTVGLDSIIKSMFSEYESPQHPVEVLETQSSFASRVADGVRSFAHPSKTLLRGVGRAIEERVPELPQILAHPRGEQGYMQPNTAQTFDDQYTTAIIGTRNAHYILYDLAARTRFNTGRFSYLIRPLVHMLEEKVGGPLRVEEKEKPGDRYHGIMKALSDESTPLEHPWLLFSIPPRVVGLVEAVLRVANVDGQGFPNVEQQKESVMQDRLRSTSFESLVWNIAKKAAAKPFSVMTKWVTRSCITFGSGVKQCAQCAYAPFKKPLKKGQDNISTVFRGQFKKHPRLACLVEHLNTKSRFVLREYATPQGIARKIRALLPIGIVGTLERYMREKHPASESLILLQNFIANHHLEVFTDTMVAAISHNSQRIRDFANRYLRIQHIDPITEDVIQDERLRNDLGSFVQALPRTQEWLQNQETGEWTVRRIAMR